MSNLIQISSVVPEAVASDKLLIVQRWKDTDKQPISAANRVRCIELPKTIYSQPINAQISDSAFSLFIQDAVIDLAQAFLKSIIEDSKWMRTEVNADAFNLSNLLTWQAEVAANSGRLNAELIKAWIANSFTIAAVKEAHSEKHATALGEQFIKLAGPNHGLTKEKATAILSKLWKVEDLDDSTGMRIAARLTAISTKVEDANLLGDLL